MRASIIRREIEARYSIFGQVCFSKWRHGCNKAQLTASPLNLPHAFKLRALLQDATTFCFFSAQQLTLDFDSELYIIGVVVGLRSGEKEKVRDQHSSPEEHLLTVKYFIPLFPNGKLSSAVQIFSCIRKLLFVYVKRIDSVRLCLLIFGSFGGS